MRILAGLRDDAANYYRVQCPFLVLHHQGVDVEVRRPSVEAATEYDVLWLQMHAEPVADIIIREFQQRGKRVVYDVDDWLFELPPSWHSYGHFYEWGTGQANERLQLHKRALAAADMVTCTTEYLAQKLRAKLWDLNPGRPPNVQVLPNCVMMGDWDTLPDTMHAQDGPVLGWFGTASHWDDWREVAEPVTEALQAVDGYLALMGAPEVVTCFPAELRARTMVHPLVPMRRFEQVRPMLKACDAGLAWATDSLEVSRCRSPLKALQWGAAGVPIVASTTVYGDVLGESLYTPCTRDVLAGRIVDLLQQPPYPREKLTAQWQARVWELHSYEMQSGRWIDALEKLF